MLLRPSRERRGPDPLLGPRMLLLAAGGVMAIAGFMLHFDWLITGAIVVLAIGIGLSFRRTHDDPDPVPDQSAEP